MPGLGRRAGAAAALILAVLLCTPASPAGADPVVKVDKPAADATLDNASVTIAGTATASDSLLDGLVTIKRVTLTLDGKGVLTKDCTTRQCPFTYTAAFPLNGPHAYTIAATDSQLGLDGPTTTTDRKFSVAAPAARPVLDAPKITDGRTVDLSWSRNTEGDMLYYAVFRKDPGASKYFQVGGKVNQPTSGTKVTFSDTTTSTFGAGDYSYQIVAVRKGATGTAGSEKLSEPSAAATAAVPAPPTTTPTTAPAPGTPGAGPTTTAKPAPPAGVDLSGFLSARQTPATVPVITVPEPPDTGFKGTLPFGARPPGEELEEGDADATPPRDTGGSSIVSLDGGRPLVPVAGGLVLLLIAMHMRLLGKRVKAPAGAGTDLPVVAATPAPAPALTPAPAAPLAPATERDPEPVLFDIAAEEDWGAGEDWAPPAPAADPEAEPDLVTVWASAVEDEPQPPAFNPDEIEVVEVVSSTRRTLARAGSR